MNGAHGQPSPPLQGRREAEVALAWAACRVDGRLHMEQWRALQVVLGRGRDVELGGGLSPDSVLEEVGLLAEELSLIDRAQLFLTTTWTAIADGRTHGAEVWLLCELRRALDLQPTLARRLYRLARAYRSTEGRRPEACLARVLAEGCRVAAVYESMTEAA